jgi:hypothetical protein
MRKRDCVGIEEPTACVLSAPFLASSSLDRHRYDDQDVVRLVKTDRSTGRVLLQPYPEKRVDPVSLCRQTAVTRPVVRKNSTTVTQHRPRGCTRGEVRSLRGAPLLDLRGRNDAFGVEAARGYSQSYREGRDPTKSAVDRDCNAPAKRTGFFEDALRIPGSSNPGTHAGSSRSTSRRTNSPADCAPVF